MEGAPISLEVIAERLRSYDSRIRSNHDSLARMRERENTRDGTLIRIETKVEEQADDIAEMKNDMKWIKRGLFGAIAVGLMFTVAVASLVIQAAS